MAEPSPETLPKSSGCSDAARCIGPAPSAEYGLDKWAALHNTPRARRIGPERIGPDWRAPRNVIFGGGMETELNEDAVEAEDAVDESADAAGDEDAGQEGRQSDDAQVTGDTELTAVIRFAGKQFKVRSGSFFDACVPEDGDQQVVEDVLLASGDGTVLGSPTIDGAKVALELQSTFRSRKTINFKRRRRKHSSKRTKGQRQNLSRFVVTSIDIPGLGRSEYAPAQDQRQLDSAE